MARLDQAKQFAHQLLDDAKQRKTERVTEATTRLDAGKATLTAMLEGQIERPAPRTATVGKLTQTMASYAGQLAPHRSELAQAIRQIEAAQSELQRGAQLSKVSRPLETMMTKLLDRADVPRDAMPRDLLGDLVNDEPDVTNEQKHDPTSAVTTASTAASSSRLQLTSRVYKPLGDERSAKRVAVPALAQTTGWIDQFKPKAAVVQTLEAKPQTTEAKTEAKTEPRVETPVRKQASIEASTKTLPVALKVEDKRAQRPTQPIEVKKPIAPVQPQKAPKTKTPVSTQTIAPAQTTRTQLQMIATSSISAAAKQSLDIDALEQELVIPQPRTTRFALGTQVPELTNRVAQTPLPPALQMRPRRAPVKPNQVKDVAAKQRASTAQRDAQRVRDQADAKTQQRLAIDRMKAQTLTDASTTPVRAKQRELDDANRPQPVTKIEPKKTTPIVQKSQLAPTPSLQQKPVLQQPVLLQQPTLQQPAQNSTLAQKPTLPQQPALQQTKPTLQQKPTVEQLPQSVDPVKPTLPKALTMKPPRVAKQPTPKTSAVTPTTTLAPKTSTDPSLATTQPDNKFQTDLDAQKERVAQIDKQAQQPLDPQKQNALRDELDGSKKQAKHKAQHHQQHQQQRHQQGKHKAGQNRQKVDARAQELARRQQEYAANAKKQLTDELTQSSDMALKLLDATKEQRIEILKARLEEQKPRIAKSIQDGKDAAQKRWDGDKKVLEQAHTDATTKIGTDCDAAIVQTTADFKQMRQQLQTNPEQAALQALANSKRDQDKFEQTKTDNIKQITTTAQTTLKGLHERVAAAIAASGKKDKDGKLTPEAETAGKMIGQLTGQIGQTVAQEAKDIAAETTKYDGLISRRKEAGDNAARDIRTDAKGYLASLDTKETQAKQDIERLRTEGKQLADDRYTHDVERIQHELDAEFQLLDAQRVNAEIESEQAIKLAMEDTTEMSESDKQAARAKIIKNRDDGLRKITSASLAKLGEMSELVATSRVAIDKELAGLGEKTVVAQHQISALETEFSRSVDQTRQKLEGQTNRAILSQKKAAVATKAGLAVIRSGRFDRESDMKWGDVSRDLMAERADFSQQKQQEERSDKQRQEQLDHLKTYEDPEGRRNLKPEQEPWTEQTRQKKAQELMKAMVGGLGDKDVQGRLMYDYNAIRLAFATMTPDQIHDLLDHNPELKDLFSRGNGADKLCLDQVINAKDPTEMRAALLNWSTNGALGNDKTTNAVGALVSPIGYLWTAGGYDKATMEAMFNSMSPEEKKQLDATYKDKYGLSVIDEIKDETYSVANRDELMASWSSDPAEKLRLQAQNSQLSGTYGNILGTIKNTAYLFGYEVSNEQAMKVFSAPQELVAWGLDTITGGTAREDQLHQMEKKELDVMIDPNALMNAQRDYLKSMQPLPTDSPVEKLRKKQQFDQTTANLRVADGRSLAELDDAAANNAYQKLWGGNQEMTNAFEALRKGDEEKFMRDRMLAGLKQHLGSETWIKEGVEDAAKRGKMGELKEVLAGQGLTYDQMVEQRFRPWFGDHDNVDSTYFKVLGEEPADPKTHPDDYARQTAAKLAYYQLGGITGWGNDTASIEKEIAAMPKDLKDQIAAHYKLIVKDQTTMLPTWLAEITQPFGNWSTGDVWQDLELTYGGEWNRWSHGWVGGKGADWQKLQYDIQNGKATTPEEQYRRALARYQIDMSNTDNMSPLIIAQAKREMERMEDAYTRLPPALRTANLDSLGDDQRAQLADMNVHLALAGGWQDTGNATQVSYVETVGWVIGTAVATVIIVAGTILTDGALAAALVAVSAAVIGGLTTMGVKSVMLGDKYSGTALQQDFANMVIDAVMAGVIGAGEVIEVADKLVTRLGIQDKVAQMILKELISNAENIPGGLAHALNNPELWKGDSSEVLAKLGSLVKTEAMRAIVTTGAAVVTRTVGDIPMKGATRMQSTVLETIKAGSGAMVDIDPSQPMGDQVLNVFKAAAVAGIQTFAKSTAEQIRDARKQSTALAPTKKPAANTIAVENDGKVVMTKETYAEQLREMRRAAEANGEKVSWKQRPTVDEHGRMVIDVQVGDKTVVVAVGDGETKQSTPTKESNEPKQITTSEEPKQLGDGNQPKQIATSEEPKQLVDSVDEAALKRIAQRPVTSNDEVQPTLTYEGLSKRADELRAQHPELAKLGKGELEALISMHYAEGADVNRGLTKQGSPQLQKDAELYGTLVSKALAALPGEAGQFRQMIDLDERWLNVKPGEVVQDPSFMQVGRDKTFSSPGKTELVIEGFNGKRTDFVMKNGRSDGPVMFDRNTKFEVVSVSADRSKIVLRELAGWNHSMLETADKTPWTNNKNELSHAQIAAVEKHLAALGKILPEQRIMLDRLTAIADGKSPGTQRERYWYLHESFEVREKARLIAENPNLDEKAIQNLAHFRTIRAMGGIGDNPYDILTPDAAAVMEKRASGGFTSKKYRNDEGDSYERDYDKYRTKIPGGQREWEPETDFVQPPLREDGYRYATPGDRIAITEIPVAGLVPTQATVTTGKVAEKVGNLDEILKNPKAIQVVEKDGQLYVIDGHHTSYAAWQDQRRTVKVQVLTVEQAERLGFNTEKIGKFERLTEVDKF